MEEGKEPAWGSYKLLDSGGFSRLESLAGTLIQRPAPAAVWGRSLDDSLWSEAQARFERLAEGKGLWHYANPQIKSRRFPVEVGGIKFNLQLTGFGHLGLFPEQELNWQRLKSKISQWESEQGAVGACSVLNLFAYTGGSTMASSIGGAQVTHVDASKTSVDWARENASLNSLSEAPIRWIVDDVTAFVQRQRRRGQRYQGVILDPPSFGRGPKGQMWKIEEDLSPLLEAIRDLLDPDRAFVLLSSHSPGYTPTALANILNQAFKPLRGKVHWAEEMLVLDQQAVALPSGACAWWESD